MEYFLDLDRKKKWKNVLKIKPSLQMSDDVKKELISSGMKSEHK